MYVYFKKTQKIQSSAQQTINFLKIFRLIKKKVLAYNKKNRYQNIGNEVLLL